MFLRGGKQFLDVASRLAEATLKNPTNNTGCYSFGVGPSL